MERGIFIYGMGFVTLWDTVTTIYGTSGILGTEPIQIFISILFGLIISGFLIRTIPIMENPSEDLITIGAKILWVLALLYDLYTSFVGNQDLLLNSTSGDISKLLITVGLTIFVSSAPIAISKALYD